MEHKDSPYTKEALDKWFEEALRHKPKERPMMIYVGQEMADKITENGKYPLTFERYLEYYNSLINKT